jgi:hypothetical protein
MIIGPMGLVGEAVDFFVKLHLRDLCHGHPNRYNFK